MAHKYSVILVTLASDGGNVWERPREVLETVAGAGYDGVDLDAEPDRIDARLFNEVASMAASLGLEDTGAHLRLGRLARRGGPRSRVER